MQANHSKGAARRGEKMQLFGLGNSKSRICPTTTKKTARSATFAGGHLTVVGSFSKQIAAISAISVQPSFFICSFRAIGSFSPKTAQIGETKSGR